MDTAGQFKLLLWKDLLVRRRHLGVASLIFGWAIAVFLILYIVRESVDTEYSPACQYKARALPSTGLFPFLQSFVCNVDNKCGNLSQYEEMPGYKEARLTNIAQPLQSAFTNESILKVVKNLPEFIRLFKSVGRNLDTPDMEGLFGSGIPISEMFDDFNNVKLQLKAESLVLDSKTIDDIFNASFKIGPVFKSLTSSDMGSTVCEPKELKKYLILNESYYINEVASALCNISGKSVPSLLQNVISHADFTQLLAMLGKVSNRFTNYDVYEDISNIVDVFLNLDFVKKSIPPNLKLSQWLPRIIPLMKTMNRTYLDDEFVAKSLDIIEPYFNNTQEWPAMKSAILQILQSLVEFQNIIVNSIEKKHNYTTISPKSFSDLISKVQEGLVNIRNMSDSRDRSQQITIDIVNAGLNLAQQLYLNSANTWLKIANTLDSVTHFLDNHLKDAIETVTFLYKESILTLHNLLRNYFESEDIIYDITQKHSDIVSTLFSLGPDFINSMLNCFNNVTCTTILIQNRHNISNIFCHSQYQNMFPTSIKNINSLCNVNFNNFMNDVVENFNFDRINKTVLETENRIYHRKYEKEGNFSQAVIYTENLINYIINKTGTSENKQISWEHIIPSIENPQWKSIVSVANKNKGLYLLNTQLCYIKEILKNKTDLNRPLHAIQEIMRGYTAQYKLFQPIFTKSFISHLPVIIDTAVRAFTNNTQLMTMISIDDWDHYFCNSTALDDNVKGIAKIACEKMSLLKSYSMVPWYRQPFFASIHFTIKNYDNLTNFDWNSFIIIAQQFYLTIDDVVNSKLPVIKWHEMEVFQHAFWHNWIRNSNIEVEIQFGMKISLKILSIIDGIYFDTRTRNAFHEIYVISSTVNNIAVFVNDIVDFAIIANNSKSYRLDDYYPETYNLSKIVIQSLDDIIRDFNIWLSQDADVSDLIEWFKNPCTKNITTILPTFSKQSKIGLSALENAVCSNAREYVSEFHFNIYAKSTQFSYQQTGAEWQLAVDKFSKLMRDVRNVQNHPNDTNIGGQWNTIGDELSNNYKRSSFYTLLMKIVDKELENNVLRQDTLSQLWKKLGECEKTNYRGNCSQIESDVARYTSRFIAIGLYEITNTIRQYIHTINGSSGVDPIILLGFSNTSAVYNLYAKLPDYMKVFVHSYRSKEFEMKILEKKTKGSPIRCQDIMNYLTIPENNSVTTKDIQEIGRYFCPSILDWPVLQDNLFLATVIKLQDIYLDRPVSKFQISYVTAYENLINVIGDITTMQRNGRVRITELWNKIWTKKLQQAFLDLKKLNFTSENTITRLFKYVDVPKNSHFLISKFGFGDFTFVLNHITQSLQKFESLNFTTEDLSTQADIETFRDLIAYYPKQLPGILSYAYFRNNHTANWRDLKMLCTTTDKHDLDLYLPMWMRIDEEKIIDQLCKINFESITNDTFSEKELSNVKNYNVNLEESILNFISSLISYENHNFTVSLSSILTHHLDLNDILNGTYPSDEELRNSSFQKATNLINTTRYHHLTELDELLQFNTVLFKILQGGDWWNYLINIVEQPALKVLLEIIERMPHILLHLTEAAISPHFLHDAITTSLPFRHIFFCNPAFNIDEYLHENNIIAVLHKSCRLDKKQLEIFDIEYNGTEVIRTANVHKFAEHIYDFEKNLIDLIKTGPKKFDVPKWMNETEILQEYKDFATKNSQPLVLLQTVTNIMNEVVDTGEFFYLNSSNNCPWCTWATVLVKEVSRHLTFAPKYVDFICNVPKMNITEIRTTLVDDFKWGLFSKDMTNDRNYSVNDFNREIHDVVGVIRNQLITFYTNKTLRALPGQCFKNIGNSPALKNITTYVSAISEILKFARSSSIQLFNTSSLNSSQYFVQWIEKDIPIWKPHTIMLCSNVSDDRFVRWHFRARDIYYDANVNVNELIKIKEPSDMEKYFADPILREKLLLPSGLFVFSEKDLILLSHKYFNYVKWDILEKNIDSWRNDSVRSLKWLGDIYDSLENVILNGGNILEYLSTIDFSELTSGKFNISNILTGILDILHKNSIEKLFVSLHHFMNSLSPIIRDPSFVNDMHVLLNALENMTIFENLGYLRTKYNISDLVSNWTNVREYLIEDIHLDEHIVDQILNASIDLFTIISTQKDLLNTNDLLCNPERLEKLISFQNGDAKEISKEVSATLCTMKMDDLQKIAIVVLKNMNFSHVLNNVMQSSVKNILTSANMTEADGEHVMKNIGSGVQLLPFFRSMISNISREFSDMPKFDRLESTSTSNSKVVSPGLLSAGSNMLCGRPLAQQSGKLYKTIAEAKDFNAKKYDAIEQESLPTQFCRNLYEDIVNMNAGKVIWSYMKPLIRGKILFTPDVPAVRSIIEHANTTFASIADLEEILFKMTDSLSALDNPQELKHILENVKVLLNSSMIRGIIQEAISSSTHAPKISLDNLNLTGMLDNLGDSQKISSALKFGTDILKCILLDRFIPVASENELEQEAKHLMQRNEFIAGLVFLNMDHRSKRSTDMPHNISYKIRMDIDSVPSTSYLKYKFWTPGPDGDFLDNMRYFRGFIQLQDLIDNAIIQLKSSEKLPEYNVVTQQMPYPCWTNDFFKSALSISQTFQVCFFFGLIVIVASSVRYIVWEKESGNTMVMNVMGLRYVIHCTSWFVVTLIEMLIIIISILIIIKAGGILPMSSGSLLFFFLLDFGFSVIMFCYMISSIFDSASLAAVGSAIFYLLSYMPYIIIISLETTMSMWLKVLTNLSMSTSFCYGCLYLIRYELQGVGMQWHNAWDTPILGDSMSFGMTCIFIAFDGILYGLIGYLCSRKTIDLQKICYFLPSWLFTNNYHLITETDSYVTYDNELFMGANISGDNYLDDTVSSSNIINDEPLKIGVTIKGLTKVYNSRKKTVKAIENIDITLHIGQVTTLLGHNGAGKTTLIKILTGMMPPTSGQIIINSEISDNDIKKSKYLGVCPQGSVLINTMTAMEHLIFYAKLKTGRNTMQVMPEVVEMTDSLGLGLLSNEPVANLSEGMRRRLCVAIAFIGKPKLVVLDEPSSGVDPVARRQIWDLVVRYKEGCTVLLTTHHLDEAELLSDRVVVLHKGKVLCSGSPLVLKQSYGKGYKIQVMYPPTKAEDDELSTNNVNTLLSIVRKVAPNAEHYETRISEVTIIVPFNSSAGISNNFEDVACILEESQQDLGFSTFAMNCTTLEEVFLDLCANADDKLDEMPLKNNSVSQIGQSYSNLFGQSVDDLPILKDDEVLVDTGENLTGSDFSKFLALMKKRAIHYIFDWRVIICALILPALFTAIAMGFSLIRPPNSNEPALKLSPELYMPHTTAFISVVDTNNSNSFANEASKEFFSLTNFNKLDIYSGKARDCQCTDGMQTCSKPSETTYDDTLLKLSSSKDIVDWVVETHDEYIERRYGGWSLTDQPDNKTTLVVWYNNKGYHSMPSYLNTMNSAILRTVSPGSVINTYNHPLKLSVDQLSKSSIAQHIADVGIAMVLLVAFSLVPASGAIYLVQERVNEEKRLQYLCGVSPTLYWIVAFIWDMIILVCSLILAIIVFKIFGLPVYVARDNMAAISLLIFLYGFACIPLIHLLQRWFNDASMANMILFCGCAFVGISELTCILLMDILGKTQFAADFRQILHKLYLIFPQFVLGDGLVEISKNNIQSEILARFHMDTYVSPLSWDLMGLHYLSLALVGTILFVVNLIIENKWFKSIKNGSSIQPSDTWCVETVNLTKEYKTVSGKHKAVDNLQLRVPFGQCLGLIGVNGAGKSTTFKMLTTEIQPTSGKIFLQGREIGEKPLYTGEMGYCSQSDSLDPKLTVRQTIMTYLTLRGTENPNQIVNKIMHKFELAGYANRKTENLSGGNRRKLCAALSVLGRTSLILMDEPTSGMDPYSRNLVALIIQQLIKRNRSVILTSHSVEDCETLCSQVAVMINGKVICQGSPQDLKERYGSGYIISVRLLKSTEQDFLLESMKKEFPGAELMSRQYCSSQFSVPTEHIQVSEMFKKMSKISEYVAIEDFNLVQSSLDQVFINLANKSNELLNVNGVDCKYTLPNMYSMDIL